MTIDLPTFLWHGATDLPQYLKRYLMISSAEIKNYKAFENIKLQGLRRINIIVGDNGAGKTALLEALFLGTGAATDLPLRFRIWRGLELGTGTPQDVYAGMHIRITDFLEAIMARKPQSMEIPMSKSRYCYAPYAVSLIVLAFFFIITTAFSSHADDGLPVAPDSPSSADCSQLYKAYVGIISQADADVSECMRTHDAFPLQWVTGCSGYHLAAWPECNNYVTQACHLRDTSSKETGACMSRLANQTPEAVKSVNDAYQSYNNTHETSLTLISLYEEASNPGQALAKAFANDPQALSEFLVKDPNGQITDQPTDAGIEAYRAAMNQAQAGINAGGNPVIGKIQSAFLQQLEGQLNNTMTQMYQVSDSIRNFNADSNASSLYQSDYHPMPSGSTAIESDSPVSSSYGGTDGATGNGSNSDNGHSTLRENPDSPAANTSQEEASPGEKIQSDSNATPQQEENASGSRQPNAMQPDNIQNAENPKDALSSLSDNDDQLQPQQDAGQNAENPKDALSSLSDNDDQLQPQPDNTQNASNPKDALSSLSDNDDQLQAPPPPAPVQQPVYVQQQAVYQQPVYNAPPPAEDDSSASPDSNVFGSILGVVANVAVAAAGARTGTASAGVTHAYQGGLDCSGPQALHNTACICLANPQTAGCNLNAPMSLLSPAH